MIRTLLRRRAVRPAMTALTVAAVAGAFVVAHVQGGAPAAEAQTVAPAKRVAAATAVQAMPAANRVPNNVRAARLGTMSPVVTSMSHDRGALDVFGVDAAQRIWHASWEPGDMNGWQRNTQINGGVAAPGTSVYGVARKGGVMDIFAVGTDRKVYTAHWESSFGAAWQGWDQLSGLTVEPNTSVTAVSSHLGRMDIFAVGPSHLVYNNRWTSTAGWSGWNKIAVSIAVLPNTSVFGVALDRDIVDAFAVGVTNRAWRARSSAGAWGQWENLDSEFIAGGGLYPVKVRTNEYHIFGVASTGYIITRPYTKSGGWGNWSGLLNGRAPTDTIVFGTSRNNSQIDVFHVGRDRNIYTAGWNRDSGWAGWWNIGSSVPAGGSAYAHSRETDKLDVFANIEGAGTKTTGWNPSRGWSPWFEVGPRGEGGVSAELTADIEFADTSADGWARLRIYSTGHYKFEGHLHHGGVLAKDIGFAWTIMTPTGHVFGFTTKATVGGVAHDNDFDWKKEGYDPELENHWVEIMNEGIWWWDARTNHNVGAIISDLMAAAGYAMQAAKIIAAVV